MISEFLELHETERAEFDQTANRREIRGGKAEAERSPNEQLCQNHRQH